MPIPYSIEELPQACCDVIRANKLDRAYLRPVAFRGLGGFGLSAERADRCCRRRMEHGAVSRRRCARSGHRRVRVPSCAALRAEYDSRRAKAGGNYLSGYSLSRAKRAVWSFGEGGHRGQSTGLLSEGAGENLFLVFEGALHTSPVSAALLNGITRDTIITHRLATPASRFSNAIFRANTCICAMSFSCAARRRKSRRSDLSTASQSARQA